MRIAGIIMLLLTVAGCDWLAEDYEVISADKLNRIKCTWQDPKETRWFYIGSEDGYHKFIHRDLPGDKLYQIKDTEFTIDNPGHISSNEANWTVMPWGPAYEECQQQ